MKKYSFAIFICCLSLSLSFLLYTFVFFDFNNEIKMKNAFERVLNNYDESFEQKAVSFIPFKSMLGSNDDSERLYVDSISDMLVEYGCEGYISPSRLYHVSTSAIGENSMHSAYVIEKEFIDSYNFQIEYTSDFIYNPTSISDVTVILGSSYKKLLSGQDTLDIVILQKDSNQVYQITAKIAGYFEPYQLDPINLIDTDISIYISNVQSIVDNPITYTNTIRMYTMLFEISGNIIHAKSALTTYGAIVDYEYSYIPQQMVANYLEIAQMYIIIITILSVFIIFSILLYINTIIGIYNYDLNETNNNEIKRMEFYTILTLIICCIIYAVYSFVICYINNIVLQLVPYLIVFTLICFELLYSNKRTGVKHD